MIPKSAGGFRLIRKQIVRTIRHFINSKGTGAELCLAIVSGTRRSAIGQFFSLSLVTVPEVFSKVKLTQSSLFFVSKVAKV